MGNEIFPNWFNKGHFINSTGNTIVSEIIAQLIPQTFFLLYFPGPDLPN